MYARILLDPQKLICESTAQYFDKDIISCDENEVIADCGAFTGDSAETYINLYKVYKRIYLFEPDKVNCRIAKGDICKRYSDIIIKPFGVYNENKEISFIGGDGPSSKIGEDSRSMETIQVVTIDSEIREPITFIKMDIEGSEYQAIEGAKEHIKADKPKLAICAYHKPGDIWKIAMLIKELNPQYSLYLRHYTDVFAETVLYAV